MSFSFNAAGNKADLIAQVSKEAANTEQFPNQFADAINLQLDALPADAEATLVCYGHTGWTSGQTSGDISLHLEIAARVNVTAVPEQTGEKTSPIANPGAERFPDGFTGDEPAGKSASDAAS